MLLLAVFSFRSGSSAWEKVQGSFAARTSSNISFAGMDEKKDHPAAKTEDELSVSRWLESSLFHTLLDTITSLMVYFSGAKPNVAVRFNIIFCFVTQSENVSICFIAGNVCFQAIEIMGMSVWQCEKLTLV